MNPHSSEVFAQSEPERHKTLEDVMPASPTGNLQLNAAGSIPGAVRGFHVGDDVMFFDVDGNFFDVNVNFLFMLRLMWMSTS